MAFAQVDTTSQLDKVQSISVIVILKKVLKEHEFKSLKTENLENTMSQLKSVESVYLKDNGTRSFGTLSVRGGSPSQTEVLWNGISIQNSMLGLTDVSLLHPVFYDNLSLDLSGANVYRSSSVAGNLWASTQTIPRTGIEAQLSLGSRNYQEFAGKIYYPLKSIHGVSKFFMQSSDNDFYFKNSESEQRGFYQQFFQKNEKRVWKIDLWWQDAHRSIPPLLNAAPSIAKQYDEALRILGFWSDKKNQLNIYWAQQKLNYKDAAIDIDDEALLQESKIKYNRIIFINKSLLQSNAELNLQNAQSDNYPKQVRQLLYNHSLSFDSKDYLNQLKLSGAINFHYNKNVDWSGFASIIFDKSFKMKYLNQKLSIQRGVRFPSLNERYWLDMGDPDLKNEQSLNINYSLVIGDLHQWNQSYKWDKDANISLYSKYVNDWILWQPDGGLWRPQNIKKVLSQGIEAELSISNDKENKRHRLDLELLLCYNFQNVRDVTSSTTHTFKKQLIYTPRQQLIFVPQISFETWKLNASMKLQDEVYITSDNKSALPAYIVCDMNIQKQFKWNESLFTAQFAVLNLFDQYYETIALRPMPYRNFELKLNLKIN